MRFDIITVFPNMFDSYLQESILKRAQKKKLISIHVHDLRRFATGKHRIVDDRPYGGGPGMVMKIEPIAKSINAIRSKLKRKRAKIILFSVTGKQFDGKVAKILAKNNKNLILVSGRYEGVDARFKTVFKPLELSLGPYVLTGGELPTMVLIDAVARHLPGVLGKQESLEEARGGAGIPAFTRPDIFTYKGKKYHVPMDLLSGNHKKIKEWRDTHRPRLR